MNRRVWLGAAAAWVCLWVSLAELATGGPFVVGEQFGRALKMRYGIGSLSALVRYFS